MGQWMVLYNQQEVCVVATTLEVKDSSEDLEVRLSELVIVSRVERVHVTHPYSRASTTSLGFQQADRPLD